MLGNGPLVDGIGWQAVKRSTVLFEEALGGGEARRPPRLPLVREVLLCKCIERVSGALYTRTLFRRRVTTQPYLGVKLTGDFLRARAPARSPQRAQ